MIKFRKIFIGLLLFLLSYGSGYGQKIKLYASPQGAEVLDEKGDTMLNPWCGGWSNPQFSNIDLNGDGYLDLFVFVPGNGDNKVLTFINIGNGQFQYYPEYETFFPALQYWALLVDYNHDGKADICTYASEGSGIDVYKNISDQNGLKFKKVTHSSNVNQDLVCYKSGIDTFNIYCSKNTIPVIADMDGDGDIDIISFDPAFYSAYYYKNMAVENGYSLDSIHFVFTNPTRCWGKFGTTYSVSQPVNLGLVGCGKSMKRNLHGGSSMLAVDMDNDGDLDLLYGNLYGNQVTQMTNGRINKGKTTKTDSIVSADSAVLGSHKINVSVYPAAFLAEATGDTLKDIIIAPMDGANDTPSHKTFLYRNTGNKTPGNHFQLINDNFLQETMLDYGEHAAPVFFDYNGDSLMDLVIATRANLYGGYSTDHLVLYQNIGTRKKAVYKKVDDNFGGLQRYNLAYLAPAFGDMDGDGRPDMVLGRDDGKVMYFKNIADSGGSLKMQLITDNITGVHTNAYSTPCLAHLSSDTLFDLVVGNDAGTFTWYKNSGSKKSYLFNSPVNNFGSVNTSYYYWWPTKYDSKGNVIDSALMKSGGRSSPIIGDFDHDGKLDMASGSYYGEMFFWFDISDNLTGKFVRSDSLFFNTIKNARETKTFGLFTMPAMADLDNDQYPELLIGNDMGGILYYGSKIARLGIDPGLPLATFSNAEFKVYPNPANRSFNIAINNGRISRYNILITNLLGEVVYSRNLIEGNSVNTIDVAKINPGIYFVSLSDDTGRIGVRKVIIQ